MAETGEFASEVPAVHALATAVRISAVDEKGDA
jgi:hypothetical protein